MIYVKPGKQSRAWPAAQGAADTCACLRSQDASGPHAGAPAESPRTTRPRTQVGAVLAVNGRSFELGDADEATLKVMAADPAAFPAADADQALRRLARQLAPPAPAGAAAARALRGAAGPAAGGGGGAGLTARRLHATLAGCGVEVPGGLHGAIMLVRALACGGTGAVDRAGRPAADAYVAPVADVLRALGL